MVDKRSHAPIKVVLAFVTLVAWTLNLASAYADTGLEEVVVTARKQAENLQDVPLAITAISAADLQKSGAQNLYDIANLTPGLSMHDYGSEAFTSPTIRGLANYSDVGSENNVSVFFNGVYIQNSDAINMGLMDIDRIEVVKGPVSALYGRNAFAGAINYVNHEPTDKVEGRVELTGGDRDKEKAVGVLNLPVAGDILEMRLAGVYDRFGGSWNDPVNGIAMGGYSKKDGMVTLESRPSDALKLLGTVYYGKDFFDLPAISPSVNNCAPSGGTFTWFCGQIPNAQDQPLGLQAPSTRPGFAAANDRSVTHADVRADYDFGPATLQLLTGYNDVEAHEYGEFNARRDGLTYPLIPGPGTVTTNTFYGNLYDTEDFSVDATLSSRRDQRFRWKAGGFFFGSTDTTGVDVAVNGTPIPAGQSIGGIETLFGWVTPGAVPPPNGNTDVRSADHQVSGFGAFDFDLIEQVLTLSSELRYTDEWKRQTILYNATALPVGAYLPFGPGNDASWHFWNTRDTLTYKLTPKNSLYMSAANGTKAGGFNTRATVPQDLAFNPESNWTYEVGSKNEFLDGKLIANLAVYYVNWTNLQAFTRSSDPNNPGFVEKNFGTLHDYGAELELAELVARGVKASLGIAYTDPVFQSDAYDVNGTATCLLIPSCAPRVRTFSTPSGPVQAVALDGLQRDFVSDWQITLGLDVTEPLNGEWSWLAHGDLSYKSKQYNDPDSLFWVPASTMLNLRGGVERGNLQIVLWANNVTDFTGATAAAGNLRLTDLVYEQLATYGPRRTFGLTANYKF